MVGRKAHEIEQEFSAHDQKKAHIHHAGDEGDQRGDDLGVAVVAQAEELGDGAEAQSAQSFNDKARFADEDKARQRNQTDGEGGEATGIALLRKVQQRDQAQFGGARPAGRSRNRW